MVSGSPQCREGLKSAATSPQSSIKSPVSGPAFVLALAGIRRLVVHAKATETGDLILLQALRNAEKASKVLPAIMLKSSISIALVYTTSRRIPASASTNAGPKTSD